MVAWKVCTAVAAVLLAATAVRAEDKTTTIVVGSTQVDAAPGEAQDPAASMTLTGTLSGTSELVIDRGEYWLGLFASAPSPALQVQLKLAKDEGLLVEGLQPGSPAAKAGIQQYDILLKGNDKPLAGLHDLLQLINQVKDGKLTLELLRAGKHETVTVRPTKRPAHEPGEMGGPWIREGAAARSLNVGPNFLAGGPLEFRVIRPGQILPPGSPVAGFSGGLATAILASNLADGSKVEITQHGSEPAKVVVTHGKDKWEGTSSDLSKIPEKVRPEVEKLLRSAFDHNRATGAGTVTIVGSAVAAPGFPGALAVSPDMETRLDAMQKQIDELRRSVEALKGKEKKPE